ncbi:MAG: hypothetical protein NTV40_08185 [Solirubrobacterales bacterium]|nr:hypothetical protein [Solirubrobacterales bacterium]
MADDRTLRRFELEELVLRPGTYFNPQTEILLTVDDSPEIDTEVFTKSKLAGADWILVADDLAVDETRRDEMLDSFASQSQHTSASSTSFESGDDELDDDLDLDELEPDEFEPDDLGSELDDLKDDE